MDREDYKEDDSSAIYYNWTDRVKYGQSGASGGENSVKVDVDGPDFPGLIPMPMVLTGLFRDGPFPPYTGECNICSLPCTDALAAYWVCLLNVVSNAFAMFIPSTLECGPVCCPCSRITWVTGSGMVMGDPMAWLIPSAAICGAPVYNIILYTVPIAYIADIVEDDPEIEVTVTKKEPQINLGLWRMNYDDPNQTEQGISSQAKAKTSGGRVGVSPKQSYDSHLIEVSK